MIFEGFMRRCVLFLTMFLAFASLLSGQDRDYGRSMVITNKGIAATSQYLASQAGAQILAEGGSAVDAAIAANAVLGVTEPMMNGIGGDLFMIYWDAKTGKLYGLNSSGWAPKKLTITYLRAKGFASMPEHGIQSVTVPGCVAGWWVAHQRFGRLPWKDLFTPAIYYAEHGYVVPEIIDDFWRIGSKTLMQTSEAQRVFLPDGKAPAVGQIFHNPDLAKALRLIADQGPEVFYRGAIAQAILKTSDSLGGTMQASDLSEFKPEWVQPISVDYRGWQVYEMPPNTQGLAALEMLNIMSTFAPDPAGPESAPEMYRKIEAMKLAYTDLYHYLGDPRFVKVPVAGLLSKRYAETRAALINPEQANCNPGAGKPPVSDTTYLATVDQDGDIASVIESNYDYFGSGVAVDGMGFVLQDRGALFRLDPNHPDALEPRKRPFHTIIPGFMQRGDIRVGFGIMGGSNQPLAHAQFVSNVVDYGMNIQAAMSAPRFTVPDDGQISCRILVESRVQPDVLQQLRKRGEIFDVRKAYSAMMGRGQAVLYDSRTRMKYGASDPRADGDAEPQPPSF
jgi:gamma-glutamyltranspeptidase / glutathione hydrolase